MHTDVSSRAHRVGFVLNPIAGMGGRVGLKGTDGVLARARELGAEPSAHLRAIDSLREFHRLIDAGAEHLSIEWLTCVGRMGADVLHAAGFDNLRLCYKNRSDSSAEDTRLAVRRILEGLPEIVLFCGGDGTARDVCSVTGRQVPILGIPAGVKMYSGVFGVSSTSTARLLYDFLRGTIEVGETDVLDLDEERYRRDDLVVKLYSVVSTPLEPSMTQSAKAVIRETSDSVAKEEIAEFVAELLAADWTREPTTAVLLGAGSTVAAVADRLSVDSTLLGIDAVTSTPGGVTRLELRDANEQQLLDLLDRYPHCRLLLSPLGSAGFVLGRGNPQLSPRVLRRIGPGSLMLVATPAKLQTTRELRFDTGDRQLDRLFEGKGYLSVIVGYRLRRLLPIARTS